MGDCLKKKISILKRPGFPLTKVNKRKERAMNFEETISVCLRIINNILSYTSTLEQKESKFDMSIKQGCETDSESVDTDRESEDMMDIDQYLIKCVNYLDIEKTLLILSMMLLDKMLKMNPDFILSERNVHK